MCYECAAGQFFQRPVYADSQISPLCLSCRRISIFGFCSSFRPTNRKNARVSKPSPDVVVMTEKQAKNVDIGRKIVRERRRRR